MPRIIEVEEYAPRQYHVTLACRHRRPIDAPRRGETGRGFELPRVGQVWPCPRCTPKDSSMCIDPLPSPEAER